MDAKMKLAQAAISTFHGEEAARKAAENFQRVFRDARPPRKQKWKIAERASKKADGASR